jgi:hypothetical protein
MSQRVDAKNKSCRKDAEDTNRCAAAYAAHILKQKTKNKSKRCGDVYDDSREACHTREMLMLFFASRKARIYKWASMKNRDITNEIYNGKNNSVAIIWRELAHFRRLRKQHGIKGPICEALKLTDLDDAPVLTVEIAQALRGLQMFKEAVEESEKIVSEDNLTHYIDGYLEASYSSYVCVWVRAYRQRIFSMAKPIMRRLDEFKLQKIRRQRIRFHMDRIATDFLGGVA